MANRYEYMALTSWFYSTAIVFDNVNLMDTPWIETAAFGQDNNINQGLNKSSKRKNDLTIKANIQL